MTLVAGPGDSYDLDPREGNIGRMHGRGEKHTHPLSTSGDGVGGATTLYCGFARRFPDVVRLVIRKAINSGPYGGALGALMCCVDVGDATEETQRAVASDRFPRDGTRRSGRQAEGSPLSPTPSFVLALFAGTVA